MEGVVKEENLPPGFRFHPTDEELIIFFLARKIADSSFTSRAIGNIDLNRCEPWDLPGKAKMGEKEWYFFSLRDRKYPTGLRTNRATDAGYWKTTGKDKEVYDSTNSELAGMKKTLVFYKGRAPKGEKTNWVMHEYRIQPNGAFKSGKDEWVVCRVFKKSCGGIKLRGNPMRAAPFNLEASSAALSSLLQQEPGTFNLGRSNYLSNLDLMDLTKVLRVGSSLVNTNFMAGLQPQPLQQLGSSLDVLAAPAARQNNVSSLSMPVNGHGLPVKMPIPASMAARFTLPSDMELELVIAAGGAPPHAVDSSHLGGGYWPASY